MIKKFRKSRVYKSAFEAWGYQNKHGGQVRSLHSGLKGDKTVWQVIGIFTNAWKDRIKEGLPVGPIDKDYLNKNRYNL